MSRIVTLDQIHLEHPLWSNPRTITALSNKDLDDLGDDLWERGQKDALLVQQVKMEDGTIIELALDGQRRTLALQRKCREKRVAMSTYQVKVDDYLTDDDGNPKPVELTVESSDRMLLDALAVGIKRAGLSSFEQLTAALTLHKRNPERTMADIGKAIDRSESWVSRMLKAYRLASPKLLKAWSSAKVTDEQFKDLADINPHDKQEEALEEHLGIKSKGTREAKAEARNKLKEKAQKAKEEKKAAKPASKKAAKKAAKAAKASSNGSNGHAKPSTEVFAKAKPQLSEIVELETKKKTSDPYVKGLFHMAKFAMGEMAVEDFAPAWRTYLKAVMKSEERSGN
jgi:hypothetical protein